MASKTCSHTDCTRPASGGYASCLKHRSYIRNWRRERRDEAREKGLCNYCFKEPAKPGFKMGEACLKRSKAQYEATKAKRLCWRCRKPLEKHENITCDSCMATKTHGANVYGRKLHKAVISKYGGKCACCGERNMLFLTLDHVNNDGYIERRNGHHTSVLYTALKKAKDLRPDIQVLCMNCNHGKNRNKGVCPHANVVSEHFYRPSVIPLKRIASG